MLAQSLRPALESPPALVLAASLATGITVVAIVLRLSRRWDLFDKPDGRLKCHQRPTPTLGGIAVFAGLLTGTILASFLFADRPVLRHATWLNLLAPALVVLALGVCDDLRGVLPRTKILFQLIAATMLVGSGLVIRRIDLFGLANFPLDALGVPFTLFWLVGATNAFNFIDGLDGLASGIGAITAALLAALAFSTGALGHAFVALALAGGLAAVLLFNLKPARIFLGDSGSQLAGFLLGALAIQVCTRDGVFLLPTAGLLLCVPVLDTFYAVLRRFSQGQSPALGDRHHLHHCLGRRGLGDMTVAALLWGVALTAGLFAVANFHHPGWTAAAISLTLLTILLNFGVRLGALDLTCLARRIVGRVSPANPSLPAAEIDSLWQRLTPVFEQMNLDRAVLTLEGLTDEGQANREIYQWARKNNPLMAELMHNRWSRQFLLDAQRGRVATLHLESDTPRLRDEQHIVSLIQQISENVRVVQGTRNQRPIPKTAPAESELLKAGA